MSLKTRPPCVSTNVIDVLLDAVFEDFEVVLLQVRDELPLVVADDDVGGDEVDAPPDDVAAGCGLRLL